MLVVNQVFKWFSDLASSRGAIPEEKEESRAVASWPKVFGNGDGEGSSASLGVWV